MSKSVHSSIINPLEKVKPKLCLGTAQFGMSYGVTNERGKISESEVSDILTCANLFGVSFLDTAQAYGNAEAVIGRNLQTNHTFQVISKLTSQPQDCFSSLDVDGWEDSFQQTCENLRQTRLDTLLLHSPFDLRKPGSLYLENWLSSLLERGLVDRIGVSIYSRNDLNGLNLDLINLVQLPLSLYDQRHIHDDTIMMLRDRSIAIHARSLYLQGLLLTPSEKWPTWIDSHLRKHHQALEIFSKDLNCSLIDLALGFAKQQTLIEAVVVGLCSKNELIDLYKSWETCSSSVEFDWQYWSFNKTECVDPRLWPVNSN